MTPFDALATAAAPLPKLRESFILFLELAGAGFSALAELGAGLWVLALAGAGFAARGDSIVPSSSADPRFWFSQLRADPRSGSSVWSALAELGAGGDAWRAHVMMMPFGPLHDQENSGWLSTNARSWLGFSNLFSCE